MEEGFHLVVMGIPIKTIGFVLDSPTVPRWIWTLVKASEANKNLSISYIILSNKKKKEKKFSTSLYYFYEQLDLKLFKSSINALEKVETVTTQDNLKTDLLINFCESPEEGALFGTQGTWYVDIGKQNKRGYLPFFEEIFQNETVVACSILWKKNESAPLQQIYDSYSATDLSSLHRTSNPIYWKLSNTLSRLLNRVADGGMEALETSPGASYGTKGAIPKNKTMVVYGTQRILRLIGNRIRLKAYHCNWYIGVRKHQDSLTVKPNQFSTLNFPKGHYLADPFLFEKNEKTYLFYEDAPISGKGTICCRELSPEGSPLPPKVVLQKPYHLSYPFVFEYQDSTYMIPESSENRTVELYKCIEFPNCWEKVHNIFENLVAVDSTILEFDKKFWLFTNIAPEGGSFNDELHLFYAKSPIGAQWTPHPKNPIVSDVRRARPAGRIFLRNGKIIRPSQDCSKYYGGATVLNQILRLTEDDYEEKPLTRLVPDTLSRGIGLHTVNFGKYFDTIDWRRYSPKWVWGSRKGIEKAVPKGYG